MPAEKHIRVKGIDHFLVVSRDFEKTRAFYCDLLGMEQIERPDFSFPGLWFRAGNTQIHVNLEGEDAGTAGQGEFTGNHPAQGQHLAFEVDDAAEAATHIESLGIEIVAGPFLRPDGPLQFYIYDPDGYLIELFSR